VLVGDMAGEAVEVLLAVAELREALRQRQAAQVGGVPAWPRQGAGRGGQQRFVFCRREHVRPLRRREKTISQIGRIGIG
jgi:hypothetical protein